MKAIVTVVGRDRVGIIAGVCTALADYNVNVLYISQTVMQDYFTMIMMVDAGDCPVPFAELVKTLEEEGRTLALNIHAQREDIFNAMHRI